MVVLFAFLRNLKTPLIIGIAIPFSIITTFALFFFTNISLNMMTLGDSHSESGCSSITPLL